MGGGVSEKYRGAPNTCPTVSLDPVIISDDKCTHCILKLSVDKVLLPVVQYFLVDYQKLYSAVSETLTAAVKP